MTDFAGLIDIERLSAFLSEQIPGVDPDAPLLVGRHEAGYSNETFFLTRGSSQWVLRRPPRGELLPTAHDVLREYRVLSALAGKGVRAPRPVVASDDLSIIGAPFYLMEREDGVVIREELPPLFDPVAERRRIGEEMIDALAELHAVEWQAPEVAALGRPGGYLERQVRRWSGQIDLTMQRTRQLDGIAEITEWLRANTPSDSETSVVHGDYKLDNVMLASTVPARLVSIFDWEMATLGDPLSDLGWLLAYWGDTGEPLEQVLPGPNLVTMLPGFHTREGLVSLYEQRTGRSMRHIGFYHMLALWKLTIIIEGLYMHFLEGSAANPRAGEFEWRVPLMIARMRRLLRELA